MSLQLMKLSLRPSPPGKVHDFKLVQINFITPFYIQSWLNLSLNPQKLHHVRTYIYVYTLFFFKFLGPKSHVRQPSKCLQEIDPLAPLTPAPPKTKQRKKPVLKTPFPHFLLIIFMALKTKELLL